MHMKVVAILGSPHGHKGATGKLLAEVVRGAEEAGAEVTVLSLTDLKVGPCLACDACHKTGVCPQKDDFNRIKSAMLEADGIIFASPNYISSVSAQMKAVFDRCCGLLHCQSLLDKYGAAVETSGGPEGALVQKYILGFLNVLGCWAVGSAGAMASDFVDAAKRQKALAAATQLGKTLVKAIADKRTYPDQQPQRDAFFERMKALVQFHNDDWSYEYQQWKSKGWL
jgi:multimeric flavodoxin WrbA